MSNVINLRRREGPRPINPRHPSLYDRTEDRQPEPDNDLEVVTVPLSLNWWQWTLLLVEMRQCSSQGGCDLAEVIAAQITDHVETKDLP